MPNLLMAGQVVTSLNGVTTAVSIGTSFEVGESGGIHPVNIGWQMKFATAGPTAQNTVLEGSLDGNTWLTLDTSTANAAAGEVRTVSAKAVKYLRARLTTVTIGSCTGITALILVG